MDVDSVESESESESLLLEGSMLSGVVVLVDTDFPFLHLKRTCLLIILLIRGDGVGDRRSKGVCDRKIGEIGDTGDMGESSV